MKFEQLKIILKRLFKEYVRKHLKRIFLALILSIIVAGSTAGIAWLLDPAVKKIFIEKNEVFAWTIPLLIVIAFSSKGLSLYFARTNIIRIGEEVAGELQKKIATNILLSDIKTLDNRHSGKYISNVMFDTHHVRNLVSTGVLNLMKDTFSVIALVSLMFYQNWKLAFFAIIMMPLAGALAKSLGKRIGKATARAGESSGNLATFLTEIFKGSKMIRIYQKEEQENKKAEGVINDLVEKNIKIGVVMIRATPIMEALTGFMIAGFIIFSGTLISSGELGVNNFFSFLAAMMLAYQPIRSLATINMTAFQGATAFKRISKIIDKIIDIQENIDNPQLNLKNSEIKFSNVGFKYETTHEKAIKNISFSIKGNTMAAFVGHSGAGKSTIINLLPRFYDPQEGKIEVDNQNITITEKIALRNSRRGQGLFRARVIEIEKCCRVTGLSNEKLLIASHIKSWKSSNNFERLDGSNGLLLSPHIDKLFDKYYISFKKDGSLLVKNKSAKEALKLWGITGVKILRPLFHIFDLLLSKLEDHVKNYNFL